MWKVNCSGRALRAGDRAAARTWPGFLDRGHKNISSRKDLTRAPHSIYSVLTVAHSARGILSEGIQMEISVTATIHGTAFNMTVDTETAIAAGLIRKGFQETLQDATAGEKTPEEKAKAIKERLAALVDGTYVFGAGGSRLDPVEREAREIVVALLVKQGAKVGIARKAVAKDGAAGAFAAVCRTGLARKAGLDESKVSDSDVQRAVEKNLPAVMERAKAEAARVAAGVEIDL
jgi:hypothetical protein